MALLTTHSATNLIQYELPCTRKIHVGFFAPAGVWYEVFNTVTTARYGYVGMTKTAALACVTAVDNPGLGICARAFLSGGAGMYSVEVDVYSVLVGMEAVTP